MLKVGTENISGLYVGEQKIKKAFVGEQLVFEDAPPVYTVYFYGIVGTDTENVLESSSLTVESGSSVTVNPWTIAGYAFEGWYEGDTLISSNSALTYTPTKSVTTIYCRYAKVYLLSIACFDFVGTGIFTVNGKSYSNTVSSSNSGHVTSVYLKAGEQVTLNAVSLPTGYSFNYWLSINQYGTTAQHQNPYTFTKAARSETVALYGKPASRLPAGYTEVQYVEAKSNYSSFELNVLLTSSATAPSEWSLEGYFPGTDTTTATRYIIYHRSGSGSPYNFTLYTGTNKLYAICGMGSPAAKECGAKPSGKFTLSGNCNKKTIVVNGTTYYTSATYSTAGTTASRTYINSTGDSSAPGRAGFRLYSFKVTRPDATARYRCDLVPCISPNGAVGVYDLLNAKFYGPYNSSYPWIAGPAV